MPALHSDKRSIALAVGVAVTLMVIFGWEYRRLARYLDRPSEAMRIVPGTLAAVPMWFGPWEGTDLSLDAEVVKALGADDYLNRVYVRHDGTDGVELFVVCGGRGRDLMPHRPEVCYPGAGWNLREARRLELPIPGQRALPCKFYYFDRPGLDYNAMAVLNYYIIDGQYCSDVSLLQSRAWRGRDGLRYLLQVQVACPMVAGRTTEVATKVLKDFAGDAVPAIQTVLHDVEGQSR